ncbi:MAG: dTDP-glucose 4,6-dehydratase [Chloroflexi bacterium]|nr:dTDP-glucose 4,6-dehydratase [Chloroflexota bacterium]
MPKNILVTGGAGFIGSNFVRYLLVANPDVRIVNYDSLTYAGSLENLKDLPDPERHIFVEGDINDQGKVEGLLQEYKIDALVHFAAESHVDRSILGPEAFIQTNIIGTFRLLEAVRRVYIEEKLLPLEGFRFHHISTDEVFGELGTDDPPFTEETPYAPNSPYAASKASSDHLVRAYHHTYGLPILITNCTNNYGPYQYPEKLIPLTISNALAGKRLPVYGQGKQMRDWLYVSDHCSAIWEALQRGKVGETYAVGGDTQVVNLEIVETLCEILDELKPRASGESYAELITFVKDRPGHDWRYDIDSSKIKSKLGWQAKETLHSGLMKTVQWYLDNAQWIEAINSEGEYKGWIKENYG